MILANVGHMVLVKKDGLSFLSIPIAPQALGQNKTLRGFIVLPILSAFFLGVFSFLKGPFLGDIIYDIAAGLGFGLAYLLAELPNSYIKRRLGIANGEHSKKYRVLQIFVDKSDSLIVMIFFYYSLGLISLIDSLYLFFVALLISLSVSYLLFSFKLKKSF
jgi:ABC-type bacteriocin/lantibiotic exporter with double-glycine peptidase domain